MFNKILIANRGEIACRVICTCRRLGIRTVAVFSDVDRGARHVRMADEAIHIGAAPASESYLLADRILAAAKQTGAQAVHPGYGFLSENAGFAEACASARIVFIGPPVSAIHAMGSKSAAKALMEKAGVPLTPGYHGKEQAPDFLRKQADAIGYPVLIKAVSGGGGKGMRLVEKSEDFEAALASCQREATASFGDPVVLVEKYVIQPRHIEIQVFGDSHGNVVHLFERDCSVQRRHQKVLEEAPAPGMTAERRAAMGKAATDAAKAVGYVGAGTVEFIAHQDGAFYFMEMNTRLQVEHPVTEMITGVDLVEWQLRVAAGQPLPLAQDELLIRGHALEARIYAEDADKGFLPSIGPLTFLATPEPSAHVRIDSGVEQGDQISPYYDPMIAKLIVWDEDRPRALQRMQQALAEFRIVGVTANTAFLKRLVASDSFANAKLDTGLIERESAVLFPKRAAPGASELALAALALVLIEQTAPAVLVDGDPNSPWASRNGFRLNGSLTRSLHLLGGDADETLRVEYANDGYRIHLSNAVLHARGTLNGERLRAEIDGHAIRADVVLSGERLHLFTDEGQHRFDIHDPLAHAGDAAGHHGGLLAPMPGKIIALLAPVGEAVEQGAPLLVLEAMKMEHTVAAPSAGTVKSFLVAVGDQVADGAALVDFETVEASEGAK
ncbi:MAG: acetyl/propionyl/methylcrotonyl-CoA carboxylase subunit alpha [Dokdonella sp.]